MKQNIMKSISIIIPRLDNKAPIQVAMSIAKSLTADYRVYVYCVHDCSESYKYQGISVNKLSISNFLNLRNSDIIHSHCFIPDVIGFLLKCIFYKNSIKFFTTVHCDPFEEFQNKKIKGLLRCVWLFILGKYDKVIVLNSYVKNLLAAKSIKADVIHNGKNVKFIRNNFFKEKIESFANGRKVIGTYAVFNAIKGIDQLIKYAAHMDESKCIVIAGDGHLMSEYKKMIDEHELIEKVLLLGFVSDAHNLLTYFDVFVMTSRSEGFPIALIEALSSGKPICHSNIPQFREFKRQLGYVAEVYEIDNIVSLSEKLNTCLNDIVVKNCYTTNNEIYKIHLTENSMYNSYLKCYANVY